MVASLTYDEFAKNLNTRFRVILSDSAAIDTELVEVSEHKLHPGQEEFTIVFRGPNETFLGQGIRQLEHDQIGSFDLFIVPISQDEQGTYYEAVFNRFLRDH